MQPFLSKRGAQAPDQAHGLRRLYAKQRARPVVLVHNPQVVYAAVAIEQLVWALSAQGLHTLVVDAASSARPASPAALNHLSSCIEVLRPGVSYLAAQGLPVRFAQAQGQVPAFIDQLRVAASVDDVVLIHADAADLALMFGAQPLRPVVLVDAANDSVCTAYGSLKSLAQQVPMTTFDCLMVGPASARPPARIASCLASCGARFLGASLRHWTSIDPMDAALAHDALTQLAMAQYESGLHASSKGAWMPNAATAFTVD